MKKTVNIIKHFTFLIPCLLGLGIYFILPHFSFVAEYIFARGIFKAITFVLGGIVSLIPFSLTELLAVMGIPVAITLVIVFVVKLKRAESKSQLALKVGKGVGWVVSTLFLQYMVMHGANFYRYDLPKLMELDTSQKEGEFLKDVTIMLAQNASFYRENLEGEEEILLEIGETLKQAEDGYKQLYTDYPFLKGGVSNAKGVFLSKWWSYTGIAGMYFPFLSEANVNTNSPNSNIPFTVAHELSHTKGFAREDEANFLAFLATIHSPYDEFKYSGYYIAYIHCGNALYRYNQEMWAEASSHLSHKVIQDIQFNNQYIKAHEGKVKEVSNKVNDAFISAQGVEDGVLSYNRIVELILAYYEKIDFE